jgi:threonine dehydrogenase-like Zn-dependent dehydrogenase
VRAVRCTAGGVETVTVPAPEGPGLRLRVTSAGICGSDLHAVRSGPLPFVLGHEFGGRLDDGRLVAVHPMVPCGTCAACERGAEQLCPETRRTFYGGSRDGGLSELVLVDPRCIVPVPAEVDEKAVALVEPTAVAAHAVERVAPSAGERALVLGAGSIGLLCAAVLLDRGVSVDIAARHPHQAAAARAVGANVEIGRDYSLVMDAAGTADSAKESVRCTEPGGRIGLVALPWQALPYGMGLVLKEISVIPAAFSTHKDFVAAADLLGRCPELVEALVTHRFALDDAAEAFRVAGDRSGGAIKVHLHP